MIKITYRECVCMREKIEYEQLKAFFSFYPNRVIFIENDHEKVIGIISYADFVRGLSEEKVYINKKYKRIILHNNYLSDVEKFFNETGYRSIPIMDANERLIEYYVREEELHEKLKVIPGKWLNVANPHLASLVKSKKHKIINICMINSLSECIYDYFIYYKDYFQAVKKFQWDSVIDIKEDELLIIDVENKIYADIPASICFFPKLQMELEFNLLLKHCLDKDVKLYIISQPTSKNIWNLTQEEKMRLDRGLFRQDYFDDRKKYGTLLEQVLGRKEDMDEFINSCLNLPSVIEKNQLCFLNEHSGKYVNVVQGNRITVDVPKSVRNNIYVAGNSFVFGPFVDDAHTISSFLQRKLNSKSRMEGYAVINEGIRGMCIYESIKRLNNDILKEHDIIVLFVDSIEFLESMEDVTINPDFNVMKIYHLEDRFNSLDRNTVDPYFFEKPEHPNAFAYELTADYILEIFENDYNDTWKNGMIINEIPVYKNEDFICKDNKKLDDYIEKVKMMIPKNIEGMKKGSIVMNCNPLTEGHKYLIEYAAKLVDYLYIFVVQEDRSMFSFEERLEMVQACVADNPNIVVLPSGNYIISAFTFPGYFTKQIEKPDTIIDTSKDITIFGKYIAPALDITVRFAGEEPLDYVTAQYNQTMRRILPDYGLEFIEIPRHEIDDLGVITATKVRTALAEKEYELVNKLVPETTYQILKERDYLS